MELIFKVYYSNLQRAVFHVKIKPLSNTLVNKLCKKEDENMEICQCFIGETPSFTLGRDHTITKIWEKALLSTWALSVICAITASPGFYRRWTVFEGFDKGKRGRLAQSGDAYTMGRADVWHFEQSTQTSSEFITWHESAACPRSRSCLFTRALGTQRGTFKSSEWRMGLKQINASLIFNWKQMRKAVD